VSMDKSTDLETGQAVDLGPSTDRFKTVGVKFWYDGSPYTGNMFLDAPFLNSDLMQSGLGLPRDNRGSTILPKEALGGLMRKYHDQGFQIAVHAQGDRAIRDVIDLFEAVLHESPREDHRHRIEHCALFPIDQLGRAAKLGLTPSWHINHIYYYGEALRDEILGPDRARIFMPMAAARKQGLINSLHNDSPMYPAEPFKLMRTAVTRETRNGAVIAADQAITVKEAIEAVTINAARQLFMENKVGSFEKGKLADLVVLSQNPFRVDPRKLHEICVVESYRGGNKAMI
jgi:predicted amidohydrolase YtcJ